MHGTIALLSIAAVLGPAAVYGHGRLSKPLSRDALAGTPTYLQNAPVAYGPDFGCRGFPAKTPQTTLTAGGSLTVQWTFDANHVGDCFFYLTYDTNLDQSSQNWFKIAQFRECNLINMQDQTITIPSWIPACDHCVLRYEWYALHQVTNVEFYSQCVDVKIISSASPGYLGTPRIRVPNHLPASNPTGSNNYRNAFGGTFFFTGPAVAVADTGAAGTSSPGTTSAPITTSRPVTTSAPAPAPVTTPAPAPVTTAAAPTRRSRTTAAPATTPAPATTSAPQTTETPVSTSTVCGTVRSDTRCGPNFNNAICPIGECCSIYSYCGAGSAYCGTSGLSYDPLKSVDISPLKAAAISTFVTASIFIAGIAVVLVRRSRAARIRREAEIAMLRAEHGL